MDAAEPAAWAAVAFEEFLARAPDTAVPCLDELGVLHPADKLVPRERRDVFPEGENLRVGEQRFTKIFRELVNGAGRDASGHKVILHDEDKDRMMLGG